MALSASSLSCSHRQCLLVRSTVGKFKPSLTMLKAILCVGSKDPKIISININRKKPELKSL